MIESALGGFAFGIGAMIGVSVCWFCVGAVSKSAREENKEWNKEAMAHWKKLEEHWGKIAEKITVIANEIDRGE